MTEIRAVPTGHTEYLSGEERKAKARQQKADLARAVHDGDHLWIAMMAFRVSPPIQEGTLFGADNLWQGPDVGCYVCEQAYSEQLDPICPGQPSGGLYAI